MLSITRAENGVATIRDSETGRVLMQGSASMQGVKDLQRVLSPPKSNILDAKGRPLELQDFDAKGAVGVQIGTLGHKLWVCVDGAAVLRVNAPKIELEDMRL
ncbi:hypothetical protein LCGC14_0357220 [marine sediment metagenome]|uniref:Uncharacterized protein n=1 Tax=marine sediment metagenome TaxID=412755 RepID=A0A0F9WH65_9ZZZZ